MAELVELKCRNCGSPLVPADISPQLNAARCGHCKTLFALPTAGGGMLPRPEVPLPKNFTVESTMDSLVITRRWMGLHVWPLLFFAILWNGFVIFWNYMALSKGIILMCLFGLPHTGVGLFLAYLIAATFVNSTIVRATTYQLEVSHGPLPWKGNKQIPADQVGQLYCREKITRGKNGSSSTYSVEAVLEGNRSATLITGLRNPEHALFIEQQLERHLRISDVPVAGEFGR